MNEEVGPIVPVVIDTNVLVFSIYKNTHILKFLLKGNLSLIWNNQIYKEAIEIANRLWVQRYRDKNYIHDIDAVVAILKVITQMGYEVDDMPEDWPPVSRDRDDDTFLYAALVGGAEFIVTHDEHHLLKLGFFRDIPIGTAGQLFQYLKATYPA